MAITLFFLVVAVAAFISGPRDTVASPVGSDGTSSPEGAKLPAYLEGNESFGEIDVVLRVDGSDLPAHQSVLRQWSKMFYNIFKNADPAEKVVTVTIENTFTKPAVEYFLTMLYNGELPEDHIDDIGHVVVNMLKLMERYKVDDYECARAVRNMEYEDALAVLSAGFRESDIPKIVLAMAAKAVMANLNMQRKKEKPWLDFESELPDVARSLRMSQDLIRDNNYRDKDPSSSEEEEWTPKYLRKNKYYGYCGHGGNESDVVLRVGDSEFPAHRAVLGVASRVFREIFKAADPNEKILTVPLDDNTSRRAVGCLLAYLYGCEPPHRRDMPYVMVNILKLMTRYKMNGLVKKCAEVVKAMSYKEALALLSMSYKEPDLSEKVLSTAVSVVVDNINTEVRHEERWLNFKSKFPDVAKTLKLVHIIVKR